MDEKIEAFREEVVRWRGTRRKGARPYTAEMKAKALQLAQGLRKRGVPMAAVGKRIGVCAATLYLWQYPLCEAVPCQLHYGSCQS